MSRAGDELAVAALAVARSLALLALALGAEATRRAPGGIEAMLAALEAAHVAHERLGPWGGLVVASVTTEGAVGAALATWSMSGGVMGPAS